MKGCTSPPKNAQIALGGLAPNCFALFIALSLATPTCTAGDAAATAAAIASTAVTPSSYPGPAALTPFATPTSLSARSCRNLHHVIRR